jgi:hypothetical protein
MVRSYLPATPEVSAHTWLLGDYGRRKNYAIHIHGASGLCCGVYGCGEAQGTCVVHCTPISGTSNTGVRLVSISAHFHEHTGSNLWFSGYCRFRLWYQHINSPSAGTVVVETRDQGGTSTPPIIKMLTIVALSMGAISQLRVMGGAIVLAIATSVFNSYTSPRLAEYLSQYEMIANAVYLAQSLARLSAVDRDEVRTILAMGFNRQMIVLSAFAASQIPTTALLWREKQIVL